MSLNIYVVLSHALVVHFPRAAPSAAVVGCTYHHWFRPFGKRRRYCQLPVSGRRMQRFLQFRLASQNLPIIAGRFFGDQHVARTDRVCTHCGGIAAADVLHMIHECPDLQPLRLQYAALFTPDTNTVRSFFAQQDHMQVFKFVLDCLDFLKLLTLFLLLYAIRLVVRLKHCNLSDLISFNLIYMSHDLHLANHERISA